MIKSKKSPVKSQKKSSPVTSQTVAATIEKKKLQMSKSERNELINRFKEIGDTHGSATERLKIISKLKAAGDSVEGIAEQVDLSKPQAYNLVKISKLIKQQPKIAKVMMDFKLKVTDVLIMSRNRNAKELLEALINYTTNNPINESKKGLSVLEDMLQKRERKSPAPALANKTSLSKSKSKALHNELNKIIRKYQKTNDSVTQYEKMKIASAIESLIS